MVKLLVESGADVNKSAMYCGTALETASASGQVECVKLLLSQRHENWQVQRAFYAAAENGQQACLKVFLKHRGQGARACSVKEMHKVFDRRLNETRKLTVLMQAALGGDVGCMRTLMKVGADVNKVDKQGNTLLMLAASRGRAEALPHMVSWGLSVHARNKQAETALMKASEHCANDSPVTTMKVLVENGADVNSVRADGSTALHLVRFAALNHQAEGVKYLLNVNARINVFNKEGKNAYMHHKTVVCSMTQDEEVNNILLAAGESRKKFTAPDAENEHENEQTRGRKLWTFPLKCLCSGVGSEPHTPHRRQSAPPLADRDWDCLRDFSPEELVSLQRLCRDSVRLGLLRVEPHRSLFSAVPRLGLPAAFTSYLLHNVSLTD